jgi:hypothetical protein
MVLLAFIHGSAAQRTLGICGENSNVTKDRCECGKRSDYVNLKKKTPPNDLNTFSRLLFHLSANRTRSILDAKNCLSRHERIRRKKRRPFYFAWIAPPIGRTKPFPRSQTGADDGIRTRDLRFTKPLLYQLSYVGTERAKMASATRRIKNEAAADWAQEEVQRSRRFRAAQFVLARFGAQLRNARSVRGKIRN